MARCSRVYPVFKTLIKVRFCGKKGKAMPAEQYWLPTLEHCPDEGVEETDGEFTYVYCEKYRFSAPNR